MWEMIMYRGATFLSLALAAALCLAAPLAQAQQRTKVTVGQGSPVLDVSVAANVGVPMAMKYWEDEGLDVTVQPGNATMHLQALLGGQADILYAGPATAFQAMEKGAKLRFVYLFVRRNIYYPVLLKDSPIKTVTDLKGKTMGVASYASQLTVIMKGLAKDAGLDPNTDLKFVEIGVGPQAIAALRSKQVDAWGTFDAQIAGAMERGLEVRTLTSPYLDKLALAAVYMVREDYLEKNKETLEKFFRGVAKGTLFVMTNPEAAVRAHWKALPNSKPTGLSEADAMAQALRMLSIRMPNVAPDKGEPFGEITTKMMDNYQDFLIDSGMTKKRFDSAALLAPEIWKKANAFDHDRVVSEAKAYK